MTTKTAKKTEFKIKKNREGYYIETGGYQLQSRNTKETLAYCLQHSKIHNVVASIKRDQKKLKLDPTYLPSTDTAWFKQYEYLWHIYLLVENLIFDGHKISEIVKLGNDILDNKIIAPMYLPVWVADTKRKRDALDIFNLKKYL